MSKSRYTEKHSVSVEGIYDSESGTIEIEEVGTKSLKQVFDMFDSMTIKVSVVTTSDVE